jgi:hypothetical protein
VHNTVGKLGLPIVLKYAWLNLKLLGFCAWPLWTVKYIRTWRSVQYASYINTVAASWLLFCGPLQHTCTYTVALDTVTVCVVAMA